MKVTRLFFYLLSILFVFSSAVSPAFCQDNDPAPAGSKDGMAVFDLGRIEVVGKAENAETNAVTVVDAETFNAQLKESVVDVARRLPGITVTTGSKNEPQIMLRGFSQKYLSILYDGVPMASPYYMEIDSSELPLDNIAEIKIVRGNASVLYGPNAMAGVLSIVSAKPGAKPNLSLLGTVDDEGNMNARATHGDRFGDGNLYYQVSAGFRKSDGWRMSDDFVSTYDSKENLLEDGDVRENSHYEQWSAGAKAGREWDTGEISLSFNFQDATKGIPPTTHPDDRARFWDFTLWRKYSAVLAGQTRIGENGDLRANVFYHKYDNVLEAYSDPAHQEQMWTSTYDDWSTGGVLRSAWALQPDLDLRAAFNSVYDVHNAQGDLGEPWEKYTTLTPSIAAEAEWRISPHMHLQIGASFDMYRFDDAQNVAGSPGSISGRTQDIDAAGFSLLATIPLDDRQSFTVAAARKNRFPNMHELFSNIEEFEPEDVFPLDSEVSMQYAVGYSLRHSKFGFGVSGFYYDVDDKILRPDRDGLYENIERATYKGVEIWADFGGTTGLFGNISYTYQKTENESPGQPVQPLPFVPEHHLHADAGHAFNFGTQVSAGFTYRGDVVYYSGSGDAMDVPAYSLWDLTVRHQFDSGFGVTLQALNITDENYYQEIGYEQPGRTIRLGIQYRL